MKTIKLDNPHAQKHFDFFKNMNHPHFSICSPVKIGPWVEERKNSKDRLSSSLVYLLAKVANDLPCFRRRIRDGEIIEHDFIHPSFTVPTEGTDTFSFCETKFTHDFAEFMSRADLSMKKMLEDPCFEDEPGRDDYLFMSALPWLAFTSVTHAMQYHPVDSVPRITWGKIHKQEGELVMPLAVQVHHALMDGVHLADYFKKVEELACNPNI